MSDLLPDRPTAGFSAVILSSHCRHIAVTLSHRSTAKPTARSTVGFATMRCGRSPTVRCGRFTTMRCGRPTTMRFGRPATSIGGHAENQAFS